MRSSSQIFLRKAACVFCYFFLRASCEDIAIQTSALCNEILAEMYLVDTMNIRLLVEIQQ